MKKFLFLVFVITLAFRVDGFSQKKNDRYKVKPDTLKADSLEYQLVVLEPGFETWLAMKPPKGFFTKEYYEQKNRLYVSEWNRRYMSVRNKGVYDSYIDYNPNTDYGLDLNYKLYYYFKYFEETNKIKLYPLGR